MLNLVNRTRSAFLSIVVLTMGGVLGVMVDQRDGRANPWQTGSPRWRTDRDAFRLFFETGMVTDRGLAAGIAASGWTAEEIHFGMTKVYDVNPLGVARFLYSNAGAEFLVEQTKSYSPFWMKNNSAVVALRSAIMADAADGTLSSAGIMTRLPVAFALADNGAAAGGQNVCKPGLKPPRDTSLLSWYVFLPACIQAYQVVPESGLR